MIPSECVTPCKAYEWMRKLIARESDGFTFNLLILDVLGYATQHGSRLTNITPSLNSAPRYPFRVRCMCFPCRNAAINPSTPTFQFFSHHPHVPPQRLTMNTPSRSFVPTHRIVPVSPLPPTDLQRKPAQFREGTCHLFAFSLVLYRHDHGFCEDERSARSWNLMSNDIVTRQDAAFFFKCTVI